MLRLLELRELGIRARALETAQIARRTLCIGASLHALRLPRPPLCMALDAAENRYVLTGDASGLICATDAVVESAPQLVFTTPEARAHSDVVTAVQWYPLDSGVFFSASADKRLFVWDANALECARAILFDGAVRAIAAVVGAASKKPIVAAAGAFTERIRLCDLRAGSPIHTLSGHEKPVSAVAWHPANEWILASASEDGFCMFWDIRRSGALAVLGSGLVPFASRGSPTKALHPGPPLSAMMFSPDGKFVFVSSRDGRISRWDAYSMSNTLVRFPRQPKTPVFASSRQLAISSNGKVLFAPNRTRVSMYDTSSGEDLGSLSGHISAVNCCVFNPSKLELYSGADDSHVIAWSADAPHRQQPNDFPELDDVWE